LKNKYKHSILRCFLPNRYSKIAIPASHFQNDTTSFSRFARSSSNEVIIALFEGLPA
jgi:hypothetical protein